MHTDTDTHTTIKKIGVSKILFFNFLSYVHEGYLIKNTAEQTYCKTVLEFKIVTRDEVEDSNAEIIVIFNNKTKQRTTKTTPKGKNKQAGRRLEHSQT